MNERQGELIETLQPKDTNGEGNIFGGIIMSIMDKTAAVAAWRYSKHRVVTACAQQISFHTPINVGEVVYSRATIVHVGRSSMETEIQVEVENVFQGTRRLAASGFFTMVALDDDGRPVQVPPWKPETEEEKRKWEEVERRRKCA